MARKRKSKGLFGISYWIIGLIAVAIAYTQNLLGIMDTVNKAAGIYPYNVTQSNGAVWTYTAAGQYTVTTPAKTS